MALSWLSFSAVGRVCDAAESTIVVTLIQHSRNILRHFPIVIFQCHDTGIYIRIFMVGLKDLEKLKLALCTYDAESLPCFLRF